MRRAYCAVMDMHDPELHRIGRRRDSRLRVSIPAWLETLDGKLRVALCDLSQSGAHVRCHGTLPGSGDAVLTWLHYEVMGRIVWSAPGQAGIEFDELIAPGTLISTRDIVDYGLAPDEDRQHYNDVRAWYQGYR